MMKTMTHQMKRMQIKMFVSNFEMENEPFIDEVEVNLFC